MRRRTDRALTLLAISVLALSPSAAAAQWASTYEQFYYPARDNWVFRTDYPAADRLFNAFDYGHAILYELLYTRPADPPANLEQREYDFLTRRLLVSPPRLPLEEMAIMPHYARLAPEAKQMFEWAHLLHRQVYDVLADERLDAAARTRRIDELLRYYRSRPDLAFSAHPKTMALMQEQYYSLAFRERYPKFNGLIWGYHWLQVGLYEPLVVGRTSAEKQAGVSAAVARFRQMLTDPPRSLPYQMPMTSVIAPEFAIRYPELAIIFDNLHSMHDVISDILASDRVPRTQKRAEILRAASRFRDDTTEVMTVAGWRRMARMMGRDNMGGPTVGFLPALPTPTVPRGYVMRHDRDGNMLGDEHSGHAMPRDSTPADAHAGHVMPKDTMTADTTGIVTLVRDFFGALAAGDSARAIAMLDAGATIQVDGSSVSRESYAGRRTATAAGDGQIARTSWHVHRSGDVAWVTVTIAAADSTDGRAARATGEELVVLQRRAESWRIVAIHASDTRLESR
jgi:ketosteroid isomerase-like protein